jgi:chromosome segregation ATPase
MSNSNLNSTHHNYDTCQIVMKRNTDDIKAITTVMGDIAEGVAEIKTTQAVLNTRLETIEEKLDKHNNFQDRLTRIETRMENKSTLIKENKPKGLKKWQIILGMIVLGVGLFGGISGIVQFVKDLVNALLKVPSGG